MSFYNNGKSNSSQIDSNTYVRFVKRRLAFAKSKTLDSMMKHKIEEDITFIGSGRIDKF